MDPFLGHNLVRNPAIHWTAESALEHITQIYNTALDLLTKSFCTYTSTEPDCSFLSPPDACYPYLGIKIGPQDLYQDQNIVSFGLLTEPGIYGATLTRPDLFKDYYKEQINLLLFHHKVPVIVGLSHSPIPLPFALDPTTLPLTSEDLSMLRHVFPMPNLRNIEDNIANGTFVPYHGTPLPLSLFSAERVDFSLQRLMHYTGTSASYFQRFILLTNYQRYITPFVEFGKSQLTKDSEYVCFVEPGDHVTQNPHKNYTPNHQGELLQNLPQMPAYHLVRQDGNGITFINIGIGPSNAKTITDHLSVLRPHCWIMLGHCGGLRDTQVLGDYVLAHGYIRDDHVLDGDLPPWIPIPPIAEVQVTLMQAVQNITGLKAVDLKTRIRTGTVYTSDNRNWELRVHELLLKFRQSRAIAIDIESATVAANGFRFRVPYGTLLCVSDRPLHGEIKLKHMAQNFYRNRVEQHLLVGLETMRLLREEKIAELHSRKLRGFEDPAFR